jgi:hypothetical protein
MKDSGEEFGVCGSLPPFPTSWAEAVLEYVRQPSGVAARSSKVGSNSKEHKMNDLCSVARTTPLASLQLSISVPKAVR